MTIKESNAQINKRLDYIMNYFEKHKDEYREDIKTQQKFNNEILIKVTENTVDTKNVKQRGPMTLAVMASLLSCISIIKSFIK